MVAGNSVIQDYKVDNVAGTSGRWAHVQEYIVTPSQRFSWTSATIHPDFSCKHPWALAGGNTGNRTIDPTLTTLLSKLIQLKCLNFNKVH